ncbi:diguanylate cyclase [Ketobacter nezhaii]|uniref:diguanylate cyclase n=1 Tax=Ketobacter sp. MCCC 1A13808 TaxID=2602738 RepID=UPI0018DE93F2|nr:diguanylate cyclase [Ketobacter sp. MCCC 1A13808]
MLHKEGLISFSQIERRWTWQLDQIQAQQMTDNLVELMTAKLKELPKQTLELLELAACIGNRFQLRSLVVVSQSPAANISKHLFTAMIEGVIAPISGAYQLLELDGLKTEDLTVEFAFAHDRIQQAAYSILDRNKRKEAHLNIGRLLLPDLILFQNKDILFEVTNHLNLGSELIQDEDEFIQLCQLNIQAGMRAKNSTAYHAALDYLSKAFSFTNDQWWESHYDMKLSIHTDAAEAAYLSHQFEKLDMFIDPGLKHARSLLDKVDLYIVLASAMVAQGKLREAVDMTKPVLAQLGHPYPAFATKKHVIIELIKLRWALRNTSIAQILNLPEMSDAQHIAANALGARIARAALFVEPNLLPLMVLFSARVQLKFGHTPEAVTTWGVYGMIQASELGKADKGFEYGQLAMKLVDRYENSTLRGRAIHVFNGMVRHWKEPIRNSVDPLWDAYRLSLENGDFEYAALALSVLAVYQFDTGLGLNQWRENLEEVRTILKSLNQGNQTQYIEALQQFCDNLTGKADDPSILSGDFYDIESRYSQHKDINDASLLVVDEDYSILLSYMFGDHKTALKQRKNAQVSRFKSGGFYRPVRSFMIDSLIRLANIVDEPNTKVKRKLMKAVIRNQKALKKLSISCPDNYQNKYELVAADLLRVEGDHFGAHELYDKSAKLAAAQGFIHEQALAVELCGAMHARAERDTLATPYLIQACELYTRWGSQAKVDDIHYRYPHLLSQATNTVKKSAAGTTTAHMASFDITSLMKALKAIAEEKIHSRMVEVIVASAVEFAGAQHGILILRDAEGKYFIEGEADVDGGTPRILQSLPVTSENIPQALFHFVTRTLNSVVIRDAQQPVEEIPGLELDQYIQENKVRSVLCLPIVSGGGDEKELNGVIYLENNLASGTFTQERFDTLEIIGMAAAGRLELSRKAAFDGLTGLFNHEYFQNMLSQEIAIAIRHERELALILVDIDHFKKFNDNWGHQLGDLVLREVAQLIKATCRTSDIVARYGGEEMVVILPSTDMESAQDVAQRIRACIESHPISHEGNSLSVTISLGLSMLKTPNEPKTSLIERADQALYRSKENGRNQLTIAD